MSDEVKVGNKVFEPTMAVESLPASVDWRPKGYVTGVKNQVHMCYVCLLILCLTPEMI